MPTLGTRIRNLRKKKKLTLAALAGEHLTKGMLSLIENDKAQPSMESLTYIAKKLEVEINELLETISTSDLRSLLEEANKLFKEHKYNQVVELLHKTVEEKLPVNYESAKLMEWYGEACYHTDKRDWRSYIQKAGELFLSLKLYNHSAQSTFFIVQTEMNEHRYKNALEQLNQKKKLILDNQGELDLLNELDFLYRETALLFAIGSYEEASECLYHTITLSNQKKVFYRIEELYRIAYFNAMMNKKENDMQIYYDRLSLLARFTESQNSKLNLMALRIFYYNSYVKQYDYALDLIEEFHSLSHSVAGEELDYFYLMEKGKSLYGKKEYHQALDYLLKFKELDDWNHPFDLAIMYEVFSYIALCYKKLGQKNEAYQHAKYAMEKVDKFPETPSKLFIKETYEEIKAEFDRN